jgi:hypothetical protein
MAYNLSELFLDLGDVELDGTLYEIIKITTYVDGKQYVELLNTETGDTLKMTHRPPGYKAL